MEFNKYKQRGAYHWTEYAQQTIYGKHANKVKGWVRDGRTLDIGAGDGLITHLLEAQGIDDNSLAVSLAVEKGVDVSVCSAYKLEPFLDDTFDNILLGDVIEHLETPEVALKEIKRVLKKDGYLYIVTPPSKEDGTLHDKYHYREYTPEELTSFMDKNGFQLEQPIEIVQENVRMYALYTNIK